MKAIARKTSAADLMPEPLLWIKLPRTSKSWPEHGAVLHKAVRGLLLATIEADRECRAIRSTGAVNYRWRVCFEDRELATDCATTVGYCMQAAGKFIADWPGYSTSARRALMGEQGAAQ